MTLAEHDLRPMRMKALSLYAIFMLRPMLTNGGRERHSQALSR
jgi:hypothetical protein